MSEKVPHVYQAIVEVTKAMSKEGIAKARKNDQQGYKFRGIDDVYNAVSAHVAGANLCIIPRVRERVMTERPTKSGGVSTYVVLTVDFDLVSAVDGSSHTMTTMGEAMDTADKATNKGMSAAMKYATIMLFLIPTEGDNDTENHHHEKGSLEKQLAASVEWGTWEKTQGEAISAAKTMGELQELWTSIYETGSKSPNGTLKRLAAIKDARKAALSEAQ